MDLLQEFDLSTGLLSRDDLNEDDLEDEADDVDGMFKFDDRSLDLSKLLIFLELLLAPLSPEVLVLGLILRKLEVELDPCLVPVPEAPADSSSLLCLPLLRRNVDPSISPDLRNDPEPPPGLQDMFHQSLETSCLLQKS